jgi:xanthosine utilization system XapX-like protein
LLAEINFVLGILIGKEYIKFFTEMLEEVFNVSCFEFNFLHTEINSTQVSISSVFPHQILQKLAMCQI